MYSEAGWEKENSRKKAGFAKSMLENTAGNPESLDPPVRSQAIVRQEKKEPDFARTDQDYDTVRE